MIYFFVQGVIWAITSAIGIIFVGPTMMFSSASLLEATSPYTQLRFFSSHQGGRALDGLSVEPSPRIINGVEVEPFRYPYMALLTDQHVLKCGGSLIATDIVLTAAHCSESFAEVQVGRHNRNNDSERYESFIVEEIITHPSYFRNHFLDTDPHDFAIVKLFGQSRIGQPVRINSDPYVPKSDQQMAVLGWGSTDAVNMNAHSDVLLETDAYYIPNDVCKTFEGTFRDYFIDFEQVVINATLCAMDFEDLSDSCRGDSGGPLIIKGESADEDLLVGLVSAGYGCANPNLPALYARISEADPWIRDMVCQYSENPPLDFGCPLSDTLELVYPCENLPIGRDNGNFSASTRQSGQYPPCTVLQPLINVTLTLRLDTRPEERGWLLRSKNDEGKWRSIVERPIFSYSDVEPLSTVTESLTLWDNREYEIVVLDSFGDGQDLDATDSMVLGISSRGHVLLSVNDFSGSNMHHSSFGFTVGIPATVAPTQTMAPSVSMTPTSAPTEPRPFISLVLEFGSFPQNMGFRLEVLEDYKELGEFDRPGIDNYTLMHVVYPGSFGPEDEGARIKVEIPLKGERTIIHTYRFTMTSNEGFGFSGGSYEVWLGPAMTGEFLFPGGNFYYEETHTFSIEPDGLAQAGSPTESPTSDGDTQSIGAASSVAVTFCLFLLVAWLPVLVL